MIGKGVKLGIVLIVLILTILLIGCSNCQLEDKEYYEKVPVYSQQSEFKLEFYNYTSPVVETKCTNTLQKNPSFLVDYGKKEWIFNHTIVGKGNSIRREMKIYNKQDKEVRVGLDKIYLVKGKEYQRSKNHMYFNIGSKTAKKLYVIWNTAYDPNRDVTIELLDQKSKIITNCTNTTKIVTKQGTKKIPVNTRKITGSSVLFKTRKEMICS